MSVVGDVVEERVRNWGSRKKRSTRDVRENSVNSVKEEEGGEEEGEGEEEEEEEEEEDVADKSKEDATNGSKTVPNTPVTLPKKDSSTTEVFESPKPSPAITPMPSPLDSQEIMPGLSPQEMTAIDLASAALSSGRNEGENNNDNGNGSPKTKHYTGKKGSGSESSYFFDAASSKSAIRKMSQPTVLPDNNGYVFDGIGDDRTPLVVFVNSKSGGNQGRLLISQLRRVLNPIQVHDLALGPPDRVLESFSALPKSRILVCGGDGTVAWIMDALEKLDLKEARRPPIAILPLGTGNDLARIHGWGGGYNNESLLDVLKEVGRGYVSLCDRWKVVVERKGKKTVKVFNNYFGIGADAQAALDFHQMRETKPELFFSRVTNKVWYAVLGAEVSIGRGGRKRQQKHYTNELHN